MIVKTTTLSVKTESRETFKDVTASIRKFVQKSNVQNGQVTLFVPHTTAAVTINENADPDVVTDLLFSLKKSFPDRKEFRHMEGNSDAHIKSSTIGASETVIVEDGSLKLGTWQGLYFCEFDGPRTRKLFVQVIGE